MNKRHCILYMFVCVMFCACQGGTSEQEPAHGKTEHSERQETGSAGSDTAFLEKYEQVVAEMNGGRTALLYLDDDSVPELLLLKDGEYQLYFFDGSEAKNIPLPDAGMKANAYGTRYSIENAEEEELTFFRFEYVPRKGLVRIHDGDSETRRDCYLSYEDGVLSLELETDDEAHTWNTYDAEGEITNEEFSDRLAQMGYDSLTCCAYLYGDVATAYENMGRVSDTRKALENFVNGKTDAAEYVERRCEVPEEGFAGRSFAAINEELTAGEPWWEGLEYVDFDNDGEDELIMHGYAGARLYLDVVGDTVYKVLKTSLTTDVSYAAEMEGKRVVVRTDLTHGGRKYYRVMTYDGCGCLTDWFRLSASYEGANYGAGDRFEYRNRAISMEEFEIIRDSIHDLNKEDQHSDIPLVYWDVMDQYKQILEADIDDVGQDFYQKKFLKGEEWEFVWDELYVAGKPDMICYSLEDLTGDGFPEMIMGTEVGEYWSEGQFMESNFKPYVIYYYNSKNEIEIGIATTKWYTMCLYEGGIVELKSNDVSEIRIYCRFESDLEKWETTAMIGIEWDYENAKKIGYYQEEVEETDQINHRIISEEEYLSIIKEYAESPVKLEWQKIKID